MTLLNDSGLVDMYIPMTGEYSIFKIEKLKT